MNDITLTNIEKKFGDKILFHDFSLAIERGEFLAIMGESGAGKTTLLNIMGLLEKPDSGAVTICGQKIRRFPPAPPWSCAAIAYRISFKTTAWWIPKPLKTICERLRTSSELAKKRNAA